MGAFLISPALRTHLSEQEGQHPERECRAADDDDQTDGSHTPAARFLGCTSRPCGGDLHLEKFQELLGICFLCLVWAHGFVLHKMTGVRPHRVAYLAPFVVFLAFLFLETAVKKLGEGYAHWAWAQPKYWIFPLQTFTCAALLWRLRRRFELRPLAGFGFATFIGLAALAVWISPQILFKVAPRTDGFEPHFFAASGWQYWANLTLRLLRMVVIVPFVEELFWRGFLLRFLVHENFAQVPFGTFTWRSFLISIVGFCAIHNQPDWPAAAVTGALFNLVAYRTRSLAACVLTHAVTNLALALYILRTDQWGFW